MLGWRLVPLLPAVFIAFGVMPAKAQQPADAAATLSFSKPVTSVDPQAQDRWIDMAAASNGLVIIPIMLNGQRLMALVDSGAPTMMVDASWAARHGMRYRPYRQVGSMGGKTVQTSVAPVDTLRIGGFRQDGGAIEVGDLAHLSSTAGVAIDAIVGTDFLSQFAVMIDYDAHRIRILPSGSPRPAGVAEPLDLRKQGYGFVTRLQIGGRLLSPVVIDTGNDSSLTITQSAWDKAAKPLRTTDIASMGFSSEVILTEIGRIDGIKLGGRSFDKIPVMFERVPLEAGDEARMGAKLLDRFNVFMDVKQKIMVLSPRSNAPSPDPVTMSGIQGAWSDAGLLIVHVMRGSPAQAIGLKPGERICAIDGAKVTAAGPRTSLSTWSYGPAGKQVSLTLCDGRSVRLILQEFY